jgi:hypothetical protein
MMLLVFVLAACQRREARIQAMQSAATDTAVRDAKAVQGALSASPPPPPPERGKIASNVPLDRMIIRNATIGLIVRDTAKAIAEITAAVESSGGYVSASNIWRESDVLRGKVTLRVPNARLSTSMAAIRATAVRVQAETVTSDEVTQEYVDLASQLRNYEATEEELRQLLTTVRERAKRAADILEVHQELMGIRGQIEQAKGRMRYLEQMTAFATITVDLVPDAVATPAIEPGWQPLAIVKEATRSLTNAGKSVVTAAIWLAIYVLPMLIALAIVLAIGWKLIVIAARSSRRRISTDGGDVAGGQA